MKLALNLMQTKSNYMNVIRKDNPMTTKISNEFKHWKQNVEKSAKNKGWKLSRL